MFLDPMSQSDSELKVPIPQLLPIRYVAIDAGVDSDQYIKLGTKCLGVELLT